MLGYGGQKGCREHQWCRSSVPSQGYQGSSKIRQNDMLSIRDQFREKMLERVREELGDFWRRGALCRNERISANKLSHT